MPTRDGESTGFPDDLPEEVRSVISDLGITPEHVARGGETTAALMGMSSVQAEMAMETVFRSQPDDPVVRAMVDRTVLIYCRAYCRAFGVSPEDFLAFVFPARTAL